MIDTREIVKNYIEDVIKGKGLGLEEYVKETFKGKTKEQLKKYCKDNIIFMSRRDTEREDIFNRIYGSCNTQMSYIILGVRRDDDESDIDFYKRIYADNFLFVEPKKQEDIKVKKEPEEYLQYIQNSNNRYPENIMRVLRQEEGLNEYDFSKDEELNKVEPNQAFEKVMAWDDIWEEVEIVKCWIKDIYNVDLNSMK